MQAETGIPYILVSGAFTDTPETLLTLGDLLAKIERAEAQAASPRTRSRESTGFSPWCQRPICRCLFRPWRRGLDTGGDGSINVELLGAVGAANVAAAAGSGGLVWSPPTNSRLGFRRSSSPRSRA